MSRPIAISLSPNAERNDVYLAFKTLFTPRTWFDEREVEKLEAEFALTFGKNYKAIVVNSGRSAQYLILKALGIGKGDDVAIQAFTCVAVPNAILWLNARPIYIDIDNSYNINALDLEKKLNKNVKAVLVQHTFGIPGEIDEIKKVLQKHKIALIEDCSHSLGAMYKGEKVGTLGDVSFFSFGRDKVLSSVFGGVVLTSNDDFYEKVKNLRDKLPHATTFWVLQQLLHPIAFSIILPLYKSGIGKMSLFLLQRIKLLSKAVYKEERTGGQPHYFPARMPGALAVLARNQLKKLDRFNKHRQKAARIYIKYLIDSKLRLPTLNNNSIWLRFPIRLDRRDNLYSFAKKRGVLLGDWYKGVVFPIERLSLVGYKKGTCPNAENFAETVLNLPTYPELSKEQVYQVVKLIKKWLNLR